ncbi:MAG: hypothetical protein H6656_02920 [Ardenticatenaceae bacterium]|nr:hypothetical protein [Anaerolineales bacterium]MCB9006323.1 hypothetical protein [Ardenticatenaceae bacterium]
MSNSFSETITFEDHKPVSSGTFLKASPDQKSYYSESWGMWRRDSFEFTVPVSAELTEAFLVLEMRASNAIFDISVNGTTVISNQVERDSSVTESSPYKERTWDVKEFLTNGDNKIKIYRSGGNSSPLRLKKITLEINSPTMVGVDQPQLPEVDLGGGEGEKEILKRVSKEMLGKIKAQGMPLHGGDNPPSVEGTYFLNNFVLKSSLVPGDYVGTRFSNLTMTFSDQKDHKITYSYVSGSERGDGIGSFIVGEDKKFTVGVDLNVTTNNVSSKVIVLISGTLEDNGIKNGHWANFMVNNNGRSDIFIANETGRVIYDQDGFSEKQ